MKSNKSIAELQSHIYQKKEKKYNGMHLRDNRESFKLTAQMQFNNAANQATIINNYAEARDAWNDSFNQINAFIPAYAADAGFANDHMENNMVQKSIKAATTCAGESFETHRWRSDGNGGYYGPGAWWGTDIKHFINSNAPQATGQVVEEVKSSRDLNWRNLFAFVQPGVRRIAFLSGAALANAQGSPAPGLFQTQYRYFDKANPGGAGTLCS